jgi:hypothetical protein
MTAATPTTLTLSITLTPDQLACLNADMAANNANGSNPGGEQFANVTAYLTYLQQNDVNSACASYSALYGIPITDLTT